MNNYQILANKWRPQIFDDVIGQEYTTIALKNSLDLNKIHHSYLFSGTHGTGKTTLARLFAKCMSCVAKITSKPCRKCTICNEIEKGRFVDLVEIDAASRTKVEDTRELLDNIQYAPSKGRFKIYLIDEVHMLSRHSLNALLKTLEEPPTHVKFLLATTEPQKLPMTILSRCLQFHLNKINAEKIQEKIEKILKIENINNEKKALNMISKIANGSMRDALSLTDQAIAIGNGEITFNTINSMFNTVSNIQPLELFEFIVKKKNKKIMNKLNQYAEQGINWEELIIKMITLIHNISMKKFAKNNFKMEEEEIEETKIRIDNIIEQIEQNDLQKYYQIFLIGKKELPYVPNPRIVVEMTILKTLMLNNDKDNILQKNEIPNNNDDSKIDIKDKNKEKNNKLNNENNITNNNKEKINKNIKLINYEENKKIKKNNIIKILPIYNKKNYINEKNKKEIKNNINNSINNTISLLNIRNTLMKKQKKKKFKIDYEYNYTTLKKK